MADVVNEKIWVEPDATGVSLTSPHGNCGNFFVYALLLDYSCGSLCRDDDDASSAERQLGLTTGPDAVSPADAKAFCKMLRDSGVENFANVHDCSIDDLSVAVE
jgi:hypothetical protein